MRMEMNFRLTVWTNQKMTRLCHKWSGFCYFWHKFDCAWLWTGINFFNMEMVLLFRICEPLFLQAMCTNSTKQFCCQFLWHKWNNKLVRVGFAVSAVVDLEFLLIEGKHTFRLGMLNNIQLQQHLGMIFRSPQNCISLVTLQEKWKFLLFKENTAHLTRELALMTLVITSFKGLKSLSLYA